MRMCGTSMAAYGRRWRLEIGGQICSKTTWIYFGTNEHMDVSSHISLAVFPAERRKSSLLLNPLFSLIIQKSVSPHFTTVQNAFNPLLSVALVAIIGHFRCLYWLIKYYHWPNYAASLHLGEILGWDLLQRPLPASLPRQGNNFEPPLKMPPPHPPDIGVAASSRCPALYAILTCQSRQHRK